MNSAGTVAPHLFVDTLVDWLNTRLVRPGIRVSADTQLFADGLIDSIKILKLIAWTECAVGCVIPDHQIRMDNFSTPRRIAEVFVPGAANAGA